MLVNLNIQKISMSKYTASAREIVNANLLYKAEKPPVCPSVCLHFWHADNSAVSARIETGLARNESCVFEDHKVYFYKPIVPTVH